MAEDPKTVPEYILEKYVLGELSQDRMLQIDELVQRDPLVASRIDSIKKSNQQILNQYPADTFAASVKRRYRLLSVADEVRATEKTRSRRYFLLAPVLSAALVLIVFLIHSGDDNGIPSIRTSEYIGIKGQEPTLWIFRQTSDDAELLDEDSVFVNPGDILQIGYTAAGREYGVIVSIDGAGAATLHYPPFADGSPLLEQEGRQQCPYAYELDDAPAFERFFFVTSDTPIDVSGIIDAAKVLGKTDGADSLQLELPENMKQTSIILRKKGVRQ